MSSILQDGLEGEAVRLLEADIAIHCGFVNDSMTMTMLTTSTAVSGTLQRHFDMPSCNQSSHVAV